MDVQPDHSHGEVQSGSPAGLALGDALPLLFSAARTGRLSAREPDGPPLDVWLEEGRVVHAEWGHLRDLGALEMAALLPPGSGLRFSDGERTPNRTLELSAVDVASRLAEVSRAGGSLARAIPGIEATPWQTGHRPRVIEPDTARVLDRVDGTRTVADLVSGRQPLAVVRALASLRDQGAVTFNSPEVAPPPALKVVAPPAEEEVAAYVADDTREDTREDTPEIKTPKAVPDALESPTHEVEGRPLQAPRRFPINLGLTALALLIAVGLWVAIQRTQTSDSTASGQASTVATDTRAVVVAAEPTSALTTAPTSAPVTAPTSGPTVAPASAPAAAPTSGPTAAPQVAPTLAPTSAPTAAPQVVPTVAPTSAPTAAPQVVPTVGPTSATAAPQAPTVGPTTPPTAVPTPAPAVAPTSPASPPTAAPLLDETFAAGDDGWPNAASSSAFWDTAGYHLVPRNAGQFVAITAPSATPVTDGSITGLFRKLAGPVGGGYGLILRAQAPLDGSNQGGRYYVFEVGDRGEVGAWRREQNQWIELQPWKASEAVHAGAAENSLQVRVVGPQFTFSVNGTPVAQVTDPTLPSGAVGVFTGGDGNQVVLERFTVASN